MDRVAWTEALEAFAREQRQEHPLPAREDLAGEEDWCYRIIGGDFISWSRQRLPDILTERLALRVKNFDPEPLIVFSTSTPGLVAARDIIPPEAEGVFCVPHEAFDGWDRAHPVDSFTFHVHFWSYFARPEGQRLAYAREHYPDVPADELRVHHTGELWGERCGLFGDHLWRWHDEEMELLQEAFAHGQF